MMWGWGEGLVRQLFIYSHGGGHGLKGFDSEGMRGICMVGEYLADVDYGLATTVHSILHALVLGYQATFTLKARWL